MSEPTEERPRPSEADLLFAYVRRRYAERLTAEELDALRRSVDEVVRLSEALRAVNSAMPRSHFNASNHPRRPMNPVFRPLRELADAVRERRVSPVALAETFLERLERLGPRYNAVVTLTRDRALTQARRAEGEIAAGRWRGPLHGIPYGAKDLLPPAAASPRPGAPRHCAGRPSTATRP